MPGLYNVYATWPESTNVKAEGCNFTITNEGDDVFIPMVQQQTILGKVPPGSHNWLKIADRVRLVTGRTYTVTQAANSTGGVCMRSHGVMWELVEPDEPGPTLTPSAAQSTLKKAAGRTSTASPSKRSRP